MELILLTKCADCDVRMPSFQESAHVQVVGQRSCLAELIAAAKGMSWESPRGPMSIDPQTRDVVQTIYIRKVEKVDGQPQNVAFDKVENVKDPAGERRK